MASKRSIAAHLYMLLAATAVPLLLMLGYAVASATASLVENAKASARTMAVITAADIDRVLRTNRQALERIAERPAIRDAALGRCDPFLEDFHQVFPVFANATVIDPQGVAICSAVPQPGGKPVFVGKAEWFQRALAERRFVVGRPFLGPITGRWVSVLISPVRRGDGAVQGYLGFPIDLVAYRPSISDASLAEGTHVTVLDDKQTVIWRSFDTEAWVGKSLADSPVSAQVRAGKTEFLETGMDGLERIFFIERLSEADWTVVVGIPTRDLYADAWRTGIRNSVLGLGLLALTLALAARLARGIAGPMRSLSRVAARIRGGETDLRASLNGPVELVEVAREFNAMVDVREAQNRALAAQGEALRQSNVELEQFAYVASHDLQTPLRNIISYTQLLERRYRGQLDRDADDFLDFIVGGATQMSRLIGDLLAYARVTSQGKPVSPIPARQALDVALVNLHLVIDAVDAVVCVGDLPRVMADESQLVSVFQNLIGNALKYHHPDRRPEVTVAAEPYSPTHWRFTVTDNGIGIEAQYHEKVFEMFQRLAPTASAEGTGIGLTLCRRMIRRLGGEIGVISTPGQATTFWFTLRKVPEETGE